MTHFSQVSLKQMTHLCSLNAFGSRLHLTQMAITKTQYIKAGADRHKFDRPLRGRRQLDRALALSEGATDHSLPEF